MEQTRVSRVGMTAALVFGLSLAVACSGSSSDDDGGGGNGGPAPETPIGQGLSGIGSLADEVIGKNRALYDGLSFTTSQVDKALSAVLGPRAIAASTKGGGVEPCALGALNRSEFVYNPATSGYEPTGQPTEPDGQVTFRIYEVVGNAPNTDAILGTLALTCTLSGQQLLLSAILRANGVEVIRANGFGYADPFAEPGWVSVFDLQGFLANADGSQQVDFGPFASISHFDGGKSDQVGFVVAEAINASVFNYETTGIDTSYNVSVFGGFGLQEFYFDATLQGTAEDLSGPGLLNYEQHICCFDGTLENMTVSQASSSCDEFDYYTRVPLPAGDIAAIQAAFDALTGMYITVADVAEAMGALANASARASL